MSGAVNKNKDPGAAPGCSLAGAETTLALLNSSPFGSETYIDWVLQCANAAAFGFRPALEIGVSTVLSTHPILAESVGV